MATKEDLDKLIIATFEGYDPKIHDDTEYFKDMSQRITQYKKSYIGDKKI